MEPNSLRFGGGAAVSTLSPLIAALVLLSVILVVALPRKYTVAPWLLAALAFPESQVLVFAGVHFTIMRVLIVCALLRCALFRPLKGSLFAGGLNSIDRIMILFGIAQFATFSLEWMDRAAVIKSLGSLLDLVGAYCVLRFLIRDDRGIRRTLQVLAVVAGFLGLCMLIERMTLHNIFTLLGAGPAVLVEREGKIRAQAGFASYLTAGAFGSTLIPLMVWLWADRKTRRFAILGIAGGLAMTFTTTSSTPVMGLIAGIASLCAWRLRRYMRRFRWGLLLCLLGLHAVMKAPVWALISRVDLTGASSGYHRFMLIDNSINHFFDWWLIGYKGYDTWGWDMWDLSNQYVDYALTGGLITLALFITIISLAFAAMGKGARFARHKNDTWMYWCFGSAVFAHVVTFFGVSYFDQVQLAWYALIAMISLLSTASQTRVAAAPPVVTTPWSEKMEDDRQEPVTHAAPDLAHSSRSSSWICEA